MIEEGEPAKALWRHREEVNDLLGEYPGLVYSSSDIRDSGSRAATVDVNVFPAGFNNLPVLDRASRLFRAHVEELFDGVERVGLIPENHTRNRYYVDNLYSLRAAIRGAGFRCVVVTPEERLIGSRLSGEDSPSVEYRDLSSFDADLFLLNNDLSDGPLEQLDEGGVPVEPAQDMGWWNRSKGEFFPILEGECERLAREVGIESWRLFPETQRVEDVDFQGDLDRLADSVDGVLDVCRDRQEGGEEATVFIKDDRGTYGRATLAVTSGDEVRELASSERKRMAVRKGGQRVSCVVVQEGIPTRLRVEGMPAEPVHYVIGKGSAGFFWRCLDGSPTSVLNRPGQVFRHDGGHLGERTVFLHEALAGLGHRAAALQSLG